MKKLFYCALTLGTMGSLNGANTINVQEYYLTASYEKAQKEMLQRGITPSKEFTTICDGIAQGKTEFKTSVVLTSLGELSILTKKLPRRKTKNLPQPYTDKLTTKRTNHETI